MRCRVEFMGTLPNAPRLLKGGIVLHSRDMSTVQRIIALQSGPDWQTHTLHQQVVQGGVP
jgi:hypothetical protein